MEAYAAACRAELGLLVAGGMPPATSVFFGGGTPSLLPAESLCSVLDAIPRTSDAEVTVECNPDTVVPDLISAYRRAGVNRISLGVQSMVPSVLSALGRQHDPAGVERAVDVVRHAGIENFNVDLIFGAVGETAADWELTLGRALALGPPHVSAYALTVEPGTPLGRDRGRHPDPDAQADAYLRADAVLTASGLQWYEISNFARAGYECRHNLLYWSQGDYAGVGCAAHSHTSGRRWWNVRTPERYIEEVGRGRPPVAAEEVLDELGVARENLELSLRTRGGVPSWALPPGEALTGLVEYRGQRAVLSRRGRLLANEVALRLQPAPAGARSGP